MKQSDVIESFINHSPATASNLVSTGDRLINYQTVLAEWYDEYIILVNITKYSSSTSKIQNRLDYYLQDLDAEIYKFNNLDYGVQSMKDLYNRTTYYEMDD